MKKHVNSKKIGILSTSTFFPIVLFLTTLFLSVPFSSMPSVFAQGWGPQLMPTHPFESAELDELLASEDIQQNIQQSIQQDFTPNSLSSTSKKSRRPLPSPKEYQSQRVRNAMDRTFEYGPTIIPQGFLDEDENESVPATKVAPMRTSPMKTLPKPKPRMDTISGTVSNTLSNMPEISEGEFIVDEYGNLHPYSPSMEYGNYGGYYANSVGDNIDDNINGSDYGNVIGMGGLYRSPALDSGYNGVPLIKPFGTSLLDNLTIFGGVSGFKGEADGGFNGNFGFFEGLNWSAPVTKKATLSAQAGLRAYQSDVAGNPIMRKDGRCQYFLTGGFFMRDLSYPIQGGIVYDWFHDDFYGKLEGGQFRCEISARTFSNLEYGFIGGFGTTKKSTWWLSYISNDPWIRYNLKPQNYYTLFARKHFGAGGEAEGQFGMTDNGDVILSAKAEFPVTDRFSMNGGCSMMIPKEGHGRNGWKRESWEISVGAIFYFRGGACLKVANPCRPMFDVAGNGTFFNRIVRK